MNLIVLSLQYFACSSIFAAGFLEKVLLPDSILVLLSSKNVGHKENSLWVWASTSLKQGGKNKSFQELLFILYHNEETMGEEKKPFSFPEIG